MTSTPLLSRACRAFSAEMLLSVPPIPCTETITALLLADASAPEHYRDAVRTAAADMGLSTRPECMALLLDWVRAEARHALSDLQASESRHK